MATNRIEENKNEIGWGVYVLLEKKSLINKRKGIPALRVFGCM